MLWHAFSIMPRKEGGRKKKSFFFMKPIYPLSSYLYALSTHLLYTSFKLHHHIRFSTTTLLIKKSFAFTRVVFSGWMIDFRLSFPFKRYSIYFCRDAKIIKSKTIVDCYISPPRLLFALFPFPRRGAGSARCILNSPTALVFFKQKIRQSSARCAPSSTSQRI